MTRSTRTKLIAAWALPLAVLGLGLGCSTDSPTAPVQQPGAGPGGPSAQWVFELSISPKRLPAGSPDPAVLRVKVRRADNNQAPPLGTTVVVSGSLVDFGSPGSGLSSVALSTINGRAEVLIFPGPLTGTAVITAQLEASSARTNLRIDDLLPDLVAAFSFENTTDNLSVQFINQSTGDPTSYLWNFGDGNTSSEKHPVHVYAAPGDYPVELTVSRDGESASTVQAVRATQAVFITAVSPQEAFNGDTIQIFGQGFDSAVRVLADGFLQKLISKSATLLVFELLAPTPFENEPCDSDGDGIDDGEIPVPTVIQITVEISGSVQSDQVNLILNPDNPVCVPTPEEEPAP